MEDKHTSASRLTAGMIHFDVTLGATGEVLIGALAELSEDISSVAEGLQACGIVGVQGYVRREGRKNISGTSLDFVLDSGFSLKNLANFAPEANSTPKKNPYHKKVWDRRAQPSQEEIEDVAHSEPVTKEAAFASDFFSSWLRGEPFTFDEMSRVFEASQLAPIQKSLANRMLQKLVKSLSQVLGHEASNHPLPGVMGTRLLCELVSLIQLFTKLDPINVSATTVAMATPVALAHPSHDVDENAWTLTLAQAIPTIERSWPAPFADVVGLAFLGTVCTRFGPRGESVVLKHGIGISSKIGEPALRGQALWCAPTMISSRADLAETTAPQPLPFVELSATIGQTIDLGDLINRLNMMGMASIRTWQVFENGTHPKTCLRGIMPYSEARNGVEALLITADATQVTTTLVESQALHHRSVSIPYGQGQKMQVCRVTEWLWAGKVLRADPDPHDLSALAKSTGFAQEIVRADVLASWRKWRQSEASNTLKG